MNLTDIIVLVVVVIGLAFALHGAVSHFKGEGACCGGSAKSHERKQLDGALIGNRLLRIEGMHCANCAARIEEALDAIEGVAAEADLKNHCARVRFDRAFDEARVRQAVLDAGYRVVSIEEL